MDQSIVDTFVEQASQQRGAESGSEAPQGVAMPSSAPPGGIQDRSCEWPESSIGRPWLRLFARSFDILLFSVAVEFVASMIWPGFRTGNVLLIGLVPGIVLYLVTDALLMATFGATPGKYLLRVDVVPDTWRNMTLRQALYRSFMVGWRGLAFGLPIFNFIAMYKARKQLLERGSAPWDEKGHFYVFHREVGILGPFLLVTVSILVLLFGSILSYLMNDRRPAAPLDYAGVTTSKQGRAGDQDALADSGQVPGNAPEADLIAPEAGMAGPDSQVGAAAGATPVGAAPAPTVTDAVTAKPPGSQKAGTHSMPPVSAEGKLDPQVLAAQALAGVSGTALPSTGAARHKQATPATKPLARHKVQTKPGSMLPETRPLHRLTVSRPAKAVQHAQALSGYGAGHRHGATTTRAAWPVQSPASHGRRSQARPATNVQAGQDGGAGQWSTPAANTAATAADMRLAPAGQDLSATKPADRGQTVPGASTHTTPVMTAPARTPATAMAPASATAQLPAASKDTASSATSVMDTASTGAPSPVTAPAPGTQAQLATGQALGAPGNATGRATGQRPGQDFQTPEAIPAAAPAADNAGAPVVHLQEQQTSGESAHYLAAARPPVASDPVPAARGEAQEAPAAVNVTVPDRVSGSRTYTDGEQDGKPAPGTGRPVPSSDHALSTITTPSAITPQEAPVSVEATGTPANFQQTAVQQTLPGGEAGDSALRY